MGKGEKKLNYNELRQSQPVDSTGVRTFHTERFLKTFLMDEVGVDDPVL